MHKTILIVDTPEQHLLNIAGALRRAQYLVRYITNYDFGVIELQNIKCDISITFIDPDDNMGIEFLNYLKRDHALIVRIALSNYTDSRIVDEIVSQNTAKVYMYKPWDLEGIVNVVDRIFEFKERISSEKMLRILKKISQLPTLPQLYYEVAQMANDGEDMRRIANKIESDIAIASRVLKIANSAYYGARTGSVMQAITFLGTNSIQSIILSTTFFSATSDHYDIEKLWKHSELTNRIVNHLYYYKHGKSIPSIHSSIGLLHNIGILLLFTHFTDVFKAVVSAVEDKKEELCQAEHKHLGYTHCDLGGYLLEWWDLPVSMIQSALYYLDPLKAGEDYREYVCLVHLAGYISWCIVGQDALSYKLDKEVLIHLDLTDNEVEQFKKQHHALVE